VVDDKDAEEEKQETNGVESKMAAAPKASAADKDETEEGAPAAKKQKRSSGKPQVFFDIEIEGKPAGRIIMSLRADIVPSKKSRFMDD
jgi:hypothetical protein